MNPRLKMAMLQRRGKNGRYMSTGAGMEYPFFRPTNDEYPNRPSPVWNFMAPTLTEPYPVWDRGEGRPMNQIGFAMDRDAHKDEIGYRKGHKEHGYAMSHESEEPLNPKKATEWVKSMENADGTSGEHYSMEQVSQIMEQQKIQCDKTEFYAAMNMMYSDYCKVAKKFNCSTPEFYACLAKAFLEDKDAGKGKLKKYYEYVVEH